LVWLNACSRLEDAVARNYHMTWVLARKGWLKYHKGKMYSVSCRQLGTEATKDGSWSAANEWWVVKQTEVEGPTGPESEPVSADAGEVIQKALAGWTVPELEARIEEGLAATKMMKIIVGVGEADRPVERLPNGMFVGPVASPEEGLARIKQGKSVPESLLDEVLVARPRATALTAESRGFLAERLGEDLKGREAVDPDHTIAGQVAVWLSTLRAAVANRSISAGRYGSYRLHALKFQNWLGGDRPIDILDASRLEGWWAYLSERVGDGHSDGISPDTARLSLMTAKQWMGWLAEKNLIPLPGNIRSRRLKIPTGDATPKPFPVSEVKTLLAGCDGFSERTKLYLLLMLNCGMYQNDIAELGVDEVDWEAGTVTRTRSKTRERGQKVRYRLWPETFELLDRHRWMGEPVPNDRRQPRLLLTECGTALVRCWLQDGKERRYDAVQAAWHRLVARVGRVSGSLGDLRKSSATLLDHSGRYQHCSDLFLAHSPRGMKNRHYVPPNQTQFDEAVMWLRTEYGLS